MNNKYENDDVTENEIEQGDSVQEEEESPLETIIKSIMDEYHGTLDNYTLKSLLN